MHEVIHDMTVHNINLDRMNSSHNLDTVCKRLMEV